MIDLLARIAFVENEPPLRGREAFEGRRSEQARRIAGATQELAAWLPKFAEAYFTARRQLESGRQVQVIDDLEDQIAWLLADDFMSITPWQWLQHFPRYFQAIAYRLDKARGGASSRDRESTETIRDLWDRWLAGLAENRRDAKHQAECEFRWMIEELRVSLFAQPLGTAVKVSPVRCEKLLK